MINTTISTILQIFVFAIIPFIVFYVKTKSSKGFMEYVGLFKSNAKANSAALVLSLFISVPLLVLTATNLEFKATMTDPGSVTGMIRDMGIGVEAIFTVLIIALFKTAFAEELLFRGFIAKRLISATNYKTGNLIQSVLFGAIHAGIFMAITDNVLFLTLIFFFPAIGAYLMVYINENLANGSIAPSWIAHAMVNILTYIYVGFFV